MTGCQLNFILWRTREKLWDTYGVYSLYFKTLLFTEKFRNFFTDLRFLVCEFTVKLLDIRLLLSKFFVHFSLKFRFLLINGFRTIFSKISFMFILFLKILRILDIYKITRLKIWNLTGNKATNCLINLNDYQLKNSCLNDFVVHSKNMNTKHVSKPVN